MDFMEKFGVYEDATIEECFAETGRAPVGTKWVDVNKGTAENPNMPGISNRRERRIGPMPPLEATKVLFSIAATHDKEFREGRWQRPKFMFIDVKKAHLNGRLGPDDSWAACGLFPVSSALALVWLTVRLLRKSG